MTSMSTPEDQVMDALSRIEALGVPFCAVHVAMSKLKPDNRGYRQLEIVSHLFEPLLNHAAARLFLLSNNDFLLLTANPTMSTIAGIITQVESLFADDPYLMTTGKNTFSKTFFLQKDKNELVELLQEKPVSNPVRMLPKVEKEPALEDSPAAQTLDKLIEKINQVSDWGHYLRRSVVVGFDLNAQSQEVFQRFYIPLSLIQSKLSPSIDLCSDQKLACFLSQTLDGHLMTALCDMQLTHYPQSIAVTLNADSVLTPQFDRVIQSLSARVIVQFRVSDILSHVNSYSQACKKLKDKGISCALDGVGADDFDLLDWNKFNVQYIQVNWSDKWKEPQKNILLRQFIKAQTNTQVVLINCHCEEALLFGCKTGIRLFEGPFIDSLCAFMSKQTCTFGQECTVADCMMRRAVVSGDLRRQCVHEPHLDIYTPFKEGQK